MFNMLVHAVGKAGDEIIFPSTLLNVVWLLLVLEVWQYKKKDLLALYHCRSTLFRASVYVLMVYLILQGGMFNVPQEFVYFQF